MMHENNMVMESFLYASSTLSAFITDHLISSFLHRWGNRGSERWSNLPKVAKLVSGGPGVQTRWSDSKLGPQKVTPRSTWSQIPLGWGGEHPRLPWVTRD